MKSIFSLSFLLLSLSTFSSTITIDWESKRPVDLEAKFTEKCNDGNLTAACQANAQLLKIKIKTLLPMLKESAHPENIAIYKEVATLSDPDLQQMSLAHLSWVQRPEAKEGLFESALKALFGEDSFLVNQAMKILKSGDSKDIQDLDDFYRANSDTYAFNDPSKFSDIYFQEWWFETSSFLENFRHPSEERLLVLDLPLTQTWTADGMAYRAAKGYFIPLALKDAVAFYRKSTGLTPIASLSAMRERTEKLSRELERISREMQQGNYTNVARMQEIMEEINKYSELSMKVSQLLIQEKYLEKSTTFLIPSLNPEVLDGAILLQDRPTLKGTSVIYVQRFEGIEQPEDNQEETEEE